MLLSRLMLFAILQLLVTGALAAAGAADPWREWAAWWPLTAAAADLVSLGLLAAARAECFRLLNFYRPVRTDSQGRPVLGRDLLWVLGATVAGGALAAGTNLALASWLYGDPQGGYNLLVQPLPLWAAVAAVVLFPVTTALSELPTYYGHLQPRLARLTAAAWAFVVVPVVFHALQRVTLPLVFDGAYLAWRGLMFLPFALLLSWACGAVRRCCRIWWSSTSCLTCRRH